MTEHGVMQTKDKGRAMAKSCSKVPNQNLLRYVAVINRHWSEEQSHCSKRPTCKTLPRTDPCKAQAQME
eukprot:scaffold145773_cov36-Prasinocladus_malaysianus.AAC.1